MKKLVATSLLVLMSMAVRAEFVLDGPLQFTTADGRSSDKTFSFTYEKSSDGYLFRAGAQQLSVDEVPKRYTLSLVLSKNAEVWAPDFSKKPVVAFRWQIGSHRFQLFKEVQQPAQPGDFVLDVDGTRHYFINGKPVQIHFLFNNAGISELRIEGTLKPKR